MDSRISLDVIAHIRSPFATKFGVPRQSGLVEEVHAEIVFCPAYRNMDAVRGLEAFSHIWLVWQFHKAVRQDWSPTVRPPRLGGNRRMGVFATRSPFRPNPIGLSSVKLLKVTEDPELGPVLRVAGADLMDGTPILDIKPYVPYADSHPDAVGGFVDQVERKRLRVEMADRWQALLAEEERAALTGVLAEDPRPAYQDDPDRVYGMDFGGCNVRFSVENGVLTVLCIEKCE